MRIDKMAGMAMRLKDKKTNVLAMWWRKWV
jgi:hypothetical protein